MKKLLALVILSLSGIAFLSCSSDPINESLSIGELSSKDSLATLSYLSSGFLSMEAKDSTAQTTKLSVEKQTSFTDETLDEVNEYFSLLKSFIENGPESFAQVQDQTSDRPEYDYLLVMGVQDNQYLLYYNVDVVNQEITGIFILEGVEYEIIAHSSLNDFGDFNLVDEENTEEATEVETEEQTEVETEETTEVETEDETEVDTEEATEVETEEATQEESKSSNPTEEPTQTSSTSNLGLSLLSEDDDDDEDEEDEEVKKEMTLIAVNGEDTIRISYEFKSEEDEEKTQFTISKDINGLLSEIQVEIKVENDEYKVEILDGLDSYEFKMESDDDEVEYKLEYNVDGVEGEIKIEETMDDQGNLVYRYEIEEDGEKRIIDKEDEFDDEDDDDEDDDGEDDDDEDDDDEVTEEEEI
ncbi:hypothetical protein HF295_02510 [Hujiaoplasma nucleasis]|uniref:Uncharacterized protein n=1 Tax=Hujiaoplasma nucleasis TaxID=2725268 RepID=A0A7L6N5M3_9MOLU|nr:hypothetical protein [Hujiaoplasma nucleasis]QLY39794.1 hypothetical protein HF295_02510 [Hujiaoplasma nucleasis]